MDVSNADSPICFTENGMATLSNDLQWKQANFSMTLTESEMAILVKLSHPSKVFFEIAGQ